MSSSKDNLGNYHLSDFPTNRQILSDLYDEFLKKHYSIGYIEVTVSKAKELINKFSKKTGEKVSFTAWIVKCISDAVLQFPEFNSYRKGRTKLVTFEDIDIIVMVERQIPDKVIPVPYSIRKTTKKNLLEISREIRTAQSMEVTEEYQLLDRGRFIRLYPFIPGFIRQRLIRRIIRNPFSIKKQGGLIVVTSVGMFTNTRGWVGGFGGITTLNFAIGGITQKLVKSGDSIRKEQYLQMTISLDHDIIDGGPAARFSAYLVDLLENANGLTELV
jgi:pyruvate/2-oxoglutarate dehydrogenase complex dihydrolipoamide acyltransferase (E2) component